MSSQLIFTTPELKARLIRKSDNWYIGEWKPNDKDTPWLPWICGTAEWLRLTEEEKMGEMINWHEDKRPPFSFWLALRSGSSEWNARIFLPDNILKTLEHGKIYTRKDLGIHEVWQYTFLKFPEKFQFIVESL